MRDNPFRFDLSGQKQGSDFKSLPFSERHLSKQASKLDICKKKINRPF